MKEYAGVDPETGEAMWYLKETGGCVVGSRAVQEYITGHIGFVSRFLPAIVVYVVGGVIKSGTTDLFIIAEVIAINFSSEGVVVMFGVTVGF